MELQRLIEKIKGEIQQELSPDLSSMIDHTLLRADATEEQVRTLCQEAREYKFASVCVNPSYVSLVVEMLKGSGVKTCCVIGFPLGATTTGIKVAEATEMVEAGAHEVDMVINIGAAKAGSWGVVKDDIEAVATAVKGRAILKVIIEACLLTTEEKIKACIVSKMAGADFVKTSTGFSTGGAVVEDIRLMRRVVGSGMGVKASGGVKDRKIALAMVEAGANRLGTSSGASIVKC